MESKINSFKDLIVWQKGIQLVKQTYLLSKRFPDDERFGLVSQTRRSAVSVPANIAEGWGRKTTNNFVNFLHIAQGSLCELETHLIVAVELGFVTTEEIKLAESLISEVGRMLIGLENSLKSR